MLVDLVNVTTDDGLRLDGALHPAADVPPSLGVEAVLCLHGTGGNFYSSNMMAALAARFAERGMAVLVANTRGHDGISTTAAPLGRRLQGAAYERVDACRQDVAAWLAFLRERGFARLGLLGHSLGAVKSIYALAHAPDASVQWLTALSPPRLSHAAFRDDAGKAETFLEDFARAQQLVRESRGQQLMEIRYPLPYVVSAEGYLDKYGPEERYNVRRFADRLTVPLVVTYGSDELPTSAAFRGMPEAFEQLAPRAACPWRVMVVAGADHFYSGAYAELWERIERGVARVLERRISKR